MGILKVAFSDPFYHSMIDFYLRIHRKWNLPGFCRLMSLLHKNTLRCRTSYGTVMDLVPWEYIDNSVIQEGYYESEVIEMLCSQLGDDGVLWDVGANIGLHAITAAVRNPSVKVVAFEPNPEVFRRMENNASLNPGCIQMLPLALGNENVTAMLHLQEGGNCGMSSVFNQYNGPSIKVEQRTGRSLIDEVIVPAPTALKLDVEGAELSVLSGLGDLRAMPSLKLIVFESGNSMLDNPASDPVAQLLLQAGFVLTQLVRNENTHHNLANFAALRS